jgi:hypothetical protein
MRTIVIALFGASTDGVIAELEANGFERLSRTPPQWNYPRGDGAVLYVSCAAYDPDAEISKEHAELLAAAGGRTPTVQILADVSGRVPGDAEVLHIVECTLSIYDGFAFDDYTRHAWTLQDIRSKAEFEGLGFFDYARDYARSTGDA